MSSGAASPPGKWRARIATLVVVLATAGGFAAAVPHMKFTTQITDFLPDKGDNRSAQIAALLAQSEAAKVMVVDLALVKPDTDQLRAATQALIADLQREPDVLIARSGLTEADTTAMLGFLGAYPPTAFLPASAYSDAELRRRLGDLREQLASPAGVVFRQTAPRDPLGGMWEPLYTLRATQGTSVTDDGGIVFTTDRTHAFVFVETKSSPFDSDAQRKFRAVLDGWLAKHPDVRMQTSGAAQFAIASEDQIKGDVNRIGIVSTIGILAIFLVLFGSVRMILVGMVPMLFGSAVAVLACEGIFGEIHGITIAFGTSLLGVGLDYVEHYYAHFVLTPAVPARTTMKHVGPSLVFGALTTIIGFVGIGASGLLGLRQMAVFSVIAIIASMAATYWIVPPWMPTRYRPPRTLDRVNHYVLILLRRITRRTWSRGVKLALIAIGIAIAVAGIASSSFSDNVNMLVDDKGPHVAMDRAVRDRLGPQSSTFAVVTADSEEAMLVALGKATDELERAKAAGKVGTFIPLGWLMPSAAEQRARHAAAKAATPRVKALMTELDFVPEQFADYWALLDAPPKLLSLADVRRSPLAPLVGTWFPLAKDGEPPVALIPLVGVTDVPALRALVPDAAIIAPQETIVELFAGVRVKTILSSVAGLAAIFVLLLARYRSVRKVVIALTPGVIACVATVALFVVVGTSLTILHVMSMLLVISLGVDFGIFFVDTAATPEESARTMVSIITASITTILSFGLLGLSASPGLAALGITVTSGVLLSLGACLLIASLQGQTLMPKELP